jgi:hypothetical protein
MIKQDEIENDWRDEFFLYFIVNKIDERTWIDHHTFWQIFFHSLVKEKHVNDFYLRLDRFLSFIFRLFRSFSLFNIHLTFVDVTINFRAFDAFSEHTFHSARFLVSNAKIADFFNQFLLCSNFCSRRQIRFTLNQLVFFYLIIVNFIIIIINYIVYIALLCVVENLSFARLHQIKLNLIQIIDFEWNQQKNQSYHVSMN